VHNESATCAGDAKPQIALCDGLPVSLDPRLAQFTLPTDHIGITEVSCSIAALDLSAARECIAVYEAALPYGGSVRNYRAAAERPVARLPLPANSHNTRDRKILFRSSTAKRASPAGGSAEAVAARS
jgi:hypothetical protein